ncbi:hypothetical protein RSAG8_07367, partial [Rhizoctonia solani AG-8 WAC10335]
MLGQISPEKKAMLQQAKEKTQLRSHNVEKSYVPDENSVVHQLPHKLPLAERTWWDQHGGEFIMFKGNRGGQQGAMAWIRDKFVTEWWDMKFPQAKTASEEDRAWFFKESGMGKLIWSYSYNAKRKQDRAANKGNTQEKSVMEKGKIRQRAIGHDAYRHEHPEKYDEAVNKWATAYSSQPDLNDRRKISYSVYTELSNQEQKKFKDKAITAVSDSL